ncbi:15900_t:CDS:1, partial [Gigaspora margarita]
KYGISYRRAESLNRLNANRIYAILYEQDILNQHEFHCIVDPLKIQYAIEEYPFHFICSLSKVEVQ